MQITNFLGVLQATKLLLL